MRLPHLPEWRVTYAPALPNGKIQLERISLPEISGVSIFRTPERDSFVVGFPSGAHFMISMDRKLVVASSGEALPIAHLRHLLSDQIAPRILSQLGKLVVHSACVDIAGRAVLIVGRSGLGKSTLGASLHHHGHRLMGDDATILSWRDGQAFCETVYPSLRLYIDSIKEVAWGEWREAGVLVHGSGSRRDGWLGEGSTEDCLPLAGIFFLADGGEPLAAPQSPAKACLQLIEHAFWLDPRNTKLAGKRLSEAGLIANQVSAFELSYERNYRRLEQVRQCLTEALAG